MPLSTACLCCTALTCIFQQSGFIRINWGTWSDPASLIHIWAAWLIWILLQWNIQRSSCLFIFALFFFKGFFFAFRKKCCCSIHGSSPCPADASPCMSGFLSTIRLSQDKTHMFFWSQWKSWARIMQSWVDGSAKIVWLQFDDLFDCFEVFTVHMEERGCLPVSLLFFFFKNVFKCFLYSFHFLIQNLQGRSYSEAFYLTPPVHLLRFEEQQICFPHYWKYSVSLLHWSELNHVWCLRTNSEEICVTFPGICVKGCKTSLNRCV